MNVIDKSDYPAKENDKSDVIVTDTDIYNSQIL